MRLRNTLALVISASLTLGLVGCGDDSKDDKQQEDNQGGNTDGKQQEDNQGGGNSGGSQSTVTPCSGDECTVKQQDADAKMESCDFAGAYEALDSVYAAQVRDGNVDAQTAVDRSVLGILHLLYRQEVQDILPKLGFIANSGLVDFKPLWTDDHGIFKQAFTANHDYEGLYKLIPMKIFADDNCRDDDGPCVNWDSTIDKQLTLDDVLDVLVSLKPELESIAGSLEAAARLTGTTAVTLSSKCGFDNVKLDAADLNVIAALVMAVDAAIDLLSHYDFNFRLYELIKPFDADDNRCNVVFDRSEVDIDHTNNFYRIYDISVEPKSDACKTAGVNYNDDDVDCYLGDVDDSEIIFECHREAPDMLDAMCKVDHKETPVVDACLEEYEKAYTSLTCYESNDDDEEYLVCAIPGDNEVYNNRVRVANLLIPHLFRASTSSRKAAGADGETAFKKAASLYLSALEGTAKGSFFNFKAIPAGALQDMKDFATELANGTGTLTRFFGSALKLDLGRLFKDMIFAKDGDFKVSLFEYGAEVYGDNWIGDIFEEVYGEEAFLNETLPNYIFNDSIFTHTTYISSRYGEVTHEFRANGKFDLTFASDWEDLSMFNWLNPHEYFGRLCDDGDWCDERCEEDTPYYFKDSSNPDGFVCSACSEKCGGDKPYCVDGAEYGKVCASVQSCPEGYGVFEDGATCVPQRNSSCPETLRKNDMCLSYALGDSEVFSKVSVLISCYDDFVINSHGYSYGNETVECKTVDVSQYSSTLETISSLVYSNDISCESEYLQTRCSENDDGDSVVVISGGCFKTTDDSFAYIDLYGRNLYKEVCTSEQYCGYDYESDQEACLDVNQPDPGF